MVRLELELVFREEDAGVEREARATLERVGGNLINRTRIPGAKYHALLVDVPQVELRRILEFSPEGLVAAESVMHIRPQAAVHFTTFQEEILGEAEVQDELPEGLPIAAIFDAVPLANHPRLNARLSLYDPFGLESLAVGQRKHGTAMASAVIYGDLGVGNGVPLSRPIFFVNVMFAPQDLDSEERFPDRLPADLFHEAIVQMKAGQDPAAPSVIVVNASLGDRNKPFTGRMSGWARVIDYLSHTYGVLFLISAGNHSDDLHTPDMNCAAFEDLDPLERAKVALLASGKQVAQRRILAPAESMNSLTVGALHSDSFQPTALPAMTFDVWNSTGLSTVSSALGPGFGNSVKPDVLASGGRHHVRLIPSGAGHSLSPVRISSRRMGGIVVAAPPSPTDTTPSTLGRSVGTSVATAILTGIAARSHEALEATYPDFLDIPGAQRAVLIKALLTHCARWTPGSALIEEVLCSPTDHFTRKRNQVRRYLGYGAVDGGIVLDCAKDRATLWAVGRLTKDQAHDFSVPLPEIMSGKALAHEISATVAWFTPPRAGAINYRGTRLKLIEPKDSMATFAVKASKSQPDMKQAHLGTVVHRRWTGERAAALGNASNFSLSVQREPDEVDDPVTYALVTTVAMPNVSEVYNQVRNRLRVQPVVPVRL